MSYVFQTILILQASESQAYFLCKKWHASLFYALDIQRVPVCLLSDFTTFFFVYFSYLAVLFPLSSSFYVLLNTKECKITSFYVLSVSVSNKYMTYL